VADRDVTLEGLQNLLVEDLTDQPEVLEDHDLLTVGNGDAGRLLATVLQRVQPVIGQLGDFLTRRPDPENAAFFARFGIRLVDCVYRGLSSM
jgi:hypothetical protein